MRKVFIIAVNFIMLLGSCKPITEPMSELTMIDSKYYNKKAQELFTGIAITKFKNGVISNSTEFKGGVPSGNWFAYGYKGEVIQEGKFFPVLLEEPLITGKNIKRLNISFWKEGDYSFIDVFLVGQKIFTEEVSDTIKLKKEIEQLLRLKNLIGKTDSINNLYIVKGELE